MLKDRSLEFLQKNGYTLLRNALKNLESEHVWIVHSEDGMDEISPFAFN